MLGLGLMVVFGLFSAFGCHLLQCSARRTWDVWWMVAGTISGRMGKSPRVKVREHRKFVPTWSQKQLFAQNVWFAFYFEPEGRVPCMLQYPPVSPWNLTAVMLGPFALNVDPLVGSMLVEVSRVGIPARENALGFLSGPFGRDA